MQLALLSPPKMQSFCAYLPFSPSIRFMKCDSTTQSCRSLDIAVPCSRDGRQEARELAEEVEDNDFRAPASLFPAESSSWLQVTHLLFKKAVFMSR